MSKESRREAGIRGVTTVERREEAFAANGPEVKGGVAARSKGRALMVQGLTLTGEVPTLTGMGVAARWKRKWRGAEGSEKGALTVQCLTLS